MKSLMTFVGSATAALWLTARTAGAEVPIPAPAADYVVLLHGMGRTAFSMKRLECYMKSRGYRVINVDYPSRNCTVEEISENYLRPTLEKKIVNHRARVHFITHSLGGIIVREYLSHHKLENAGRVVMLAPPNHGSEIIDRLKANPISRQFLGATSLELGTGPDELPARLGPVQFECGVIAGDCSLNPFLSSLLSGPNDGKVTVESAKVTGMRDFLVLKATHTWIMWRERTLRQVLCFLQSGRFCHCD